jgi:hypothetical protein
VVGLFVAGGAQARKHVHDAVPAGRVVLIGRVYLRQQRTWVPTDAARQRLGPWQPLSVQPHLGDTGAQGAVSGGRAAWGGGVQATHGPAADIGLCHTALRLRWQHKGQLDRVLLAHAAVVVLVVVVVHHAPAVQRHVTNAHTGIWRDWFFPLHINSARRQAQRGAGGKGQEKEDWGRACTPHRPLPTGHLGRPKADGQGLCGADDVVVDLGEGEQEEGHEHDDDVQHRVIHAQRKARPDQRALCPNNPMSISKGR